MERVSQRLHGLSAKLVQATVTGEFKDELAKKGTEIVRLKEELKSADIAKQLALKEALGTVEKERDDLKRDLEAYLTRLSWRFLLEDSRSLQNDQKTIVCQMFHYTASRLHHIN